jgi:hypothetical protein
LISRGETFRGIVAEDVESVSCKTDHVYNANNTNYMGNADGSHANANMSGNNHLNLSLNSYTMSTSNKEMDHRKSIDYVCHSNPNMKYGMNVSAIVVGFF